MLVHNATRHSPADAKNIKFELSGTNNPTKISPPNRMPTYPILDMHTAIYKWETMNTGVIAMLPH